MNWFRHGAIGALLAVTLNASLLLTISPIAQAANPKLTTNITNIEISGTKPEDKITIEGTVTNDSERSVFTVQAIFWWSAKPLLSVADLRVSQSDSRGTRLVKMDENFARITPPGGELLAHASAKFKVSATLEQLGITKPGNAYALGVQTRASLDGRSVFHTLGEDRSAIVIADEGRTVPVTNVVLLTAPSSQIHPGIFLDDSLADQLRGRLRKLLTAAKTVDAALLVDPVLTAELASMSTEYQVQTENGLVAGKNSALARDFLAEIAAWPGGENFPTLYGVPDISHIPETTATESVQQSLERTVAFFGWGRATPETVKAIASAHVRAIIATNTVGDEAVQMGSVPVLRASDAFVVSTQANIRRDYLNTEAWLLGHHGQLRIATNANEAALLTKQPWMTSRPLASLLTAKGVGEAVFRPLPYPALPESHWRAVNELRPDLNAYQQLVVETQSPTTAQNRAKLVASAWLETEPAAKSFFEHLHRKVSGSQNGSKVKLVSAKQFLLSAKSGELPISVTNGLNDPIRIRLVFTTDHPQRLQIPKSDLFTVGPGETETINVRPQAFANGSYPVTAQIVTDTGTPIGDPTAIVVEVTNLSIIGWIIVVTAGLIFIAAAGWRIRTKSVENEKATEKAGQDE